MKRILLSLMLSVFALMSFAQTDNIFHVENPDYKTSPLTGMTRKHWMDAALYMLKGAFSYIHNYDDPFNFPNQGGKTYPHEGGNTVTSNLEALCRTMFVAVPLLKENPDLEINGIKVGEYYRRQIHNLSDPSKPMYIKERTGRTSQALVELGGLALSLTVMPEILWDPLSAEDKAEFAKFMVSYGNGPTIGSNWRFFNIFIMSFFKTHGYEVKTDYLNELLNLCLDKYRGEGWYNDSPAYDYYSMWAFQMYGMIWSRYYGDQLNPDAKARFEKNFKDLVPNYPLMWSKNGEMNMYGRSLTYRMAAVVPLPLMGWLNGTGTEVNYGWMRRLASATILQFLQNPKVMVDGVPCVGYYGPFEPCVQIYSCRGSVYWMGKAFLGLLVPEDNPFWTAKENNGPWEKEFKKNQVYNHFMPGTNILVTNYPNLGASEIRAWCKEKVASDWQKFRSGENYNKFAYNTAFPWMADGKNGEVSQNYAILNNKGEWEVLRLYDFVSFEDGIYRRDAVLETDENVKFNLAEIPLPNGVLRVDRVTLPKAYQGQNHSLRLGSYTIPKLKENIKTGSFTEPRLTYYVDNGVYQIAMCDLKDGQAVKNQIVTGKDMHPMSESCALLAGRYSLSEGSHILITLQLWKQSGKKFSKKELGVVKSVEEQGNSVVIIFNDGSQKTVKFN